jgi:hypothetical protein
VVSAADLVEFDCEVQQAINRRLQLFIRDLCFAQEDFFNPFALLWDEEHIFCFLAKTFQKVPKRKATRKNKLLRELQNVALNNLLLGVASAERDFLNPDDNIAYLLLCLRQIVRVCQTHTSSV